MRFIGLDLAWSAKNATGGAVIEGDATGGIFGVSDLLRGDDEIIDFVLRYGGDGPALVSIDAPLLVPNESGQRPAEAAIGKAFGRYEASAHSANRTRLAINGIIRGEALVERLEEHGFQHHAEVKAQQPVRQVIEVYPHPAMVALFELDKTIKYKARKQSHDLRVSEFQRYQMFLRELEQADPPLRNAQELLERDIISLPKVRLKDYEDRLDSLMCAYIAYYLWYWGMARARVFGNMAEGYITTPVPRALWPLTE